MYLIQYLREKWVEEKDRHKSWSEVEYRLVCSGTLHPAGIVGDWSKSTGARLLLSKPFALIVASDPYDAYPQELALRFSIRAVTETSGIHTRLVKPDREIAADLAAMLTLFCRRQVTIACRVREVFQCDTIPNLLRDYPSPVSLLSTPYSWRERPASIVNGPHGIDYRENQPHPVPFDVGRLCLWLERLPSLEFGEAIVRTARLYTLALELIETRVEIAYQLLVSAVETAAGASLSDWSPDPEEKLGTRQALITFAKRRGIADDLAKEIAIESSKGNPWSRANFTRFLMDNVEPSVLVSEDRLFFVPEEFRPSKERISKALTDVYSIRSGATHSGKSYPAEAAIGPFWGIPSAAVDRLIDGEYVFPPIGWFERVAHSAICNWIDSAVNAAMPEIQGP